MECRQPIVFLEADVKKTVSGLRLDTVLTGSPIPPAFNSWSPAGDQSSDDQYASVGITLSGTALMFWFSTIPFTGQ